MSFWNFREEAMTFVTSFFYHWHMLLLSSLGESFKTLLGFAFPIPPTLHPQILYCAAL